LFLRFFFNPVRVYEEAVKIVLRDRPASFLITPQFVNRLIGSSKESQVLSDRVLSVSIACSSIIFIRNHQIRNL